MYQLFHLEEQVDGGLPHQRHPPHQMILHVHHGEMVRVTNLASIFPQQFRQTRNDGQIVPGTLLQHGLHFRLHPSHHVPLEVGRFRGVAGGAGPGRLVVEGIVREEVPLEARGALERGKVRAQLGPIGTAGTGAVKVELVTEQASPFRRPFHQVHVLWKFKL